jgi:H+/Cl- antiporter ClcA
MQTSKRLVEQSSIIASVAKWTFLSGIVGILIGMIVTLFLNLLHYTESQRGVFPFHYYYLLPFGLMLSVWLTRTFAPDAKGHGTEKVIEAVHKKDGHINIAVIPVKLLATVITLFTGGSAGKEGPGAQIGAGTASAISDMLRFSKRDRKKLVVCGISAGFATVFGTPIAGAIFGIEVLIVGTIMYDLLLPSIVAGFTAFFTAQYLGATYTYYEISYFQHFFIDIVLISKVILGGIFFGLVAYLIVATLKQTERIVEKIPMNPYKKAFGAGLLLVLLSFIVGDKFFGLGLDTISQTMQFEGSVAADIPWYASIMKIFYTAVTLGSGGSGGIVTPIFYIGATSGHFFGGLFGGEHQLALFAALGFVSVLAGATNAPIAAIIMAMELFGMDVAHYAAVSIAISFLVLGHRSVFPSQKISMSKSGLLEIEYGDDIEHSSVSLTEENSKQFREIQRQIRLRRLKRANREKIEKRRENREPPQES